MSYKIKGQVKLSGQAKNAVNESIIDESNILQSGFIFSSLAGTIDQANPAWNPAETSEPTYQERFGNIIDFGLDSGASWAHTYNPSGSATASAPNNTFEFFDINRTYRFAARNASWLNDKCDGNIEFLDESNNVIFAMRTQDELNSSKQYQHRFLYGANLGSLARPTPIGPYPQTNYALSFTPTQVTGTNLSPTNAHSSFAFNCDAASITKIRLSGQNCVSTYTSGAGATAWFLLQLLEPDYVIVPA